MAEICRSRVTLDWDAGSPGVCTFHWTAGLPSPLDWTESGSQMHEELQVLFEDLSGVILNQVSWTVEPVFDVLDVDSGDIVDQITLDDDPHVGTGAGTGTSSTRASQACFNHSTGLFHLGRRLRGRNFIGPIHSEALGSDGQFISGDIITYSEAWDSVISGVGPRLAVYSRPKPIVSGGVVTGYTDGFYADVTNVTLKKAPGILRSRRD